MSELLFLGTGAADWSMADRDTAEGGFFRRNSAALIDGTLMLDCGAHIFDFAESIGTPDLYRGVTDIVITHCHGDHFSSESVLQLAEKQKIRLACDGNVMRCVGEHPNIEFVLLKPFVPVMAGRYRVTPLLANHDVVADGDSYAFQHIIETPDGKTVFYGLDGAWFLRPSWEVMKQHAFDVMIFDCTVGDFDDWRLFEHNTIPMLRVMMKEICARGMVKEDGRLIASHMAKTLHGSHEETAETLQKINMLTAFDGMKLAF